MDIFKSRRFLTMLLDATVSIALHYLGGEDINFLIATLQPIFIFVIASYTVEGSVRIRQGLTWRE